MDLNSKGRPFYLVPEIEYDRIGIIQLEETYKDHPVQFPDHFRADQKLQYVARGNMPLAFVVQMLLKHWQSGILASSLGSLFLGYNTLLVNKRFLMSGLNLPCLSFEPFLCVPSLDTREKRSAHPSSPLLHRKLQRAMRSPLSFLLSKQTNSKSWTAPHGTYLLALSPASVHWSWRGACWTNFCLRVQILTYYLGCFVWISDIFNNFLLYCSIWTESYNYKVIQYGLR